MRPLEPLAGDHGPAAGGPARRSPVALAHPRILQGRLLHRLGGGLQFRGGARGRVILGQVGDRASEQALLRGETRIDVLRRQAGHGHGPLHQPGPGVRRQVGAGHHRLGAADEDPKAQVPALLVLHILQPPLADGDGQGLALRPHGFGCVRTGAQGGGDHVVEKLGIHQPGSDARGTGSPGVWRCRCPLARRAPGRRLSDGPAQPIPGA